MFDDLKGLYQEMILDHNNRPRNFRVLADANRTVHGSNPVCGDHYTIYARIDGDMVRDLGFQGSAAPSRRHRHPF